ncbi:MAG: DUF1761 domain-containing protein [Actinomycetota bacterium]|nr:DUF1761 domain-containing protein [Actinomycetota bacterium]
MVLDALGELNYLAVLVGALAYFAVGGLWYSPVLFSKPWVRATGVDPQGGPPAALYVITVLLSFVASLALALFARATGASTAVDGAVLGLVAGIGFSVTSLVVTHLYENRPPVLHFINGGYHLVALIVVGVIVTLWE